jgi:hypothetical protein
LILTLPDDTYWLALISSGANSPHCDFTKVYLFFIMDIHRRSDFGEEISLFDLHGAGAIRLVMGWWFVLGALSGRTSTMRYRIREGNASR